MCNCLPCYRCKAVAWQTPLTCCNKYRTVDRGLEGSLKAPSHKPKCLPIQCCGQYCKPQQPKLCEIEPVQRCMYDECGECPIARIHKKKKMRECYSDRFYPEELNLPRICHPRGGPSYLTSSPFRSNRVYRRCEPMSVSYAGHIPYDKFLYFKNRSCLTRNPLKFLTYRY